MKFLFPFLAGLILSMAIDAQVVNNSIASRLELNLDGPYLSSTTANSTVEWNCINKMLTKNCLVYHNDQWFTFRVSADGRYYLNIRNQSCLDKRGIQVLLIEGDPCVISTYTMIQCISKLIQEDTYVVLDSIKAGITYLVNIDGFLGDKCSFEIQLGTRPAGLPFETKTDQGFETESTTSHDVAAISWHIPDGRSGQLTHFELYRKYMNNGGRNYATIPLTRENAYGIVQKQYLFYDTLSQPGVYTYQVFGVEHSGELLLIRQQQVAFVPEAVPGSGTDMPGPTRTPLMVEIPVNFRRGEKIHVEVDDRSTGKPLKTETFTVTRRIKTVHVNFDKPIAVGSNLFRVLVYDDRRKRGRAYFYNLNEDGRLELESSPR